jgi:dimethylhistidine N-methyltransferase
MTDTSACPERAQRGRFARDVIDGLKRTPKSLPCKYFYDLKGSQLFDRITEQPAYYPTLAETQLLEAHAASIAALLGPRVDLIELGSGSSIKTRLLLNALRNPQRYVPIDISAEHLQASARKLEAAYPDLRIEPVVGDYSVPIEGVSTLPNATRVVFFPGSSVGNFEPAEAVAFLKRARALAGPRGVVLIGVDLPKGRDVLERAYDDPAGVTAAFNLNLLQRMRRELGAELEVDHFRHAAVWEPGPSRVEMRLVAQKATHITVDGERFELAPGDFIVTEHCYKHDVEGFGALAERAGLRARRVWLDPSGRVSMHWLDDREEIDA